MEMFLEALGLYNEVYYVPRPHFIMWVWPGDMDRVVCLVTMVIVLSCAAGVQPDSYTEGRLQQSCPNSQLTDHQC